MSKKTTTKTRRTTYVPVSNHIYFDGTSYRVRASVNGEKYSKNFSNKKQAFAFRKQLLASAV